MLISLGAAVFMLITIELMSELAEPDGTARFDPVRAVQAISTGVAFLAAGTIIQGKNFVHGLTTGAGIWLSGAVGLACGAGFLMLVLLTVILVLLILLPLRMVERFIFRTKPKNKAVGDDES